MALSPHTIKTLFIVAIPILAIVGSIFIPPSEKYREVPSDRPWAQEFRTNLFNVSSTDEREQVALSNKLCAGVQSELTAKTLPEALVQIDTAMKQIGATISNPPAFINKGYLTYYFQPMDRSLSLDGNYQKTLNVFAGQSIGPKYSWLNPRWYKENRNRNLESIVKQYIKIEGDLISMRFETPFPLLDEYLQRDLLLNPPPHIINSAKYAGLRYLRSERRDVFDYTYAIDMRPWYEKQFGGDNYYNINFLISARKNKNGSVDDVRIATTCKFPSKGVLYTSLGIPPAGGDTVIKPPVSIPSCPEYLKWFQCKNGGPQKECAGIPDAAPTCPADNPDFPKSEYGLVQSAIAPATPTP